MVKSSSSEMFFQNNIALLTPYILDQINYFIHEDGVEEPLMLRLMQESVKYNKRSWAYVEACLKSNVSKGIKTLAAYELSVAERSHQKGGHDNGINRNDAGKNNGSVRGTKPEELSDAMQKYYGVGKYAKPFDPSEPW